MSLIVKIGADTRTFDRAMQRLTGDINRAGNKLTSVGKSLTTGLTLPIAAVGIAAIKLGSDFEASMSKLGAVTGANGKSFDELKAKAMDMGSKTQYSAKDAADAMTELAKAGMNTKDTMAAIPGVLSMAATENMDLAQAASITSAALNEYGMKAGQASHVADVLAKNSNMSASGVESLGAALMPVAGFASQLGIPFEDLNASLGILSNNGVDGAVAGEKLMAILRGLVAPSKGAAKVMKEYGINAFDANGKLKSMPAIIDTLNSKMKGLGDQEKLAALKRMFGTESMAALLPLMKEGGKAVADYSQQLKKSNGYADETAKKMNDNLKGSFQQLSSAAETAAISLYNNVGPSLKVIVDHITKLVNAFSKLSPGQQKAIMLFAGIAAAIGPVLLIVGSFIKIAGTISAIFTLAGAATGGWATAMALVGGPVGLIIIGIIALISAIALVIFYWKDIKNVTISVWNTIGSFLSGLWKGIETWASNTWNSISKTAISVWNGIKSFFQQWGLTILAVLLGPIGILALMIYKNWDTIKQVSMTVWNSIVSFLKVIWNGMVTAFMFVFNIYKTIIVAVWGTIFAVTKAVWTFIWQYLVALWTALLYFVTPIFRSIATFLTGIWNSIKSGVMVVWNAIKSFLTTVWNGIKVIATTTWNGIKVVFTTVMNAIKGFILPIWNSIKAFLSSIWNGIKAAASSIWNAIKGAVMGPINSLKSSATSSFNSFKATVTGVWNSIKSTATSVWSSIKSSVMGTINGLVGGAGHAFSGLKGTILGVWNGIKSGIHTIINGIVGTVNHFIDGFNAPARALNKVPGVHAPTIGHIPKMATGGNIFGNGQALVGEAGPELISKSGSSVRITPLSSGEKARGIGGALGLGTKGAGQIINQFTIQATIREDADVKKLSQEINRLQEKTLRASGRIQL